MWGLFLATFYFMVGAFFGHAPPPAPPPLRKFLRAPMIARRVRSRAFFLVHGHPQGGARVVAPPPLENKKRFLAILGDFLLLFLYIGAFLLRFTHFWGPFHHVGAISCYFLLHGGGLFWACPPPPPRKFLRAPMIARRVRSRAFSPEFFLCDSNSVSSGHLLF